jgi:putative membrane protein
LARARSRSRSRAEAAARREPVTPLLKAILVAYTIVWVGAAIRPKYPSDWLLENLLVFGFVPVLVFTWRRFRFSDFSYFSMALFLCLHAYGAHYTYAETELGYRMQEWFGWSRNHYDRIVHFSFGLLMAYPMREIVQRKLRGRRFWGWLIPLMVILSLSSTYEIVESWVARLVSPELGSAYLGTQGDEWDAQKDMALAGGGAVLSLLVAEAVRRLTGRELRELPPFGRGSPK